MKTKSAYIIKFSGLSIGTHPFTYEIDKSFLDLYSLEDVNDLNINIDIDLEKHSTFLKLTFKINGNTELICDRCTEWYWQPVSNEQYLIVKFGNEQDDFSDDMIVLPYNEVQIDIAHFIYEFISLAIPLKRVHPEGECNQEMLEKIKNLSVSEEDKSIDPRWKALNNIELKN